MSTWLPSSCWCVVDREFVQCPVIVDVLKFMRIRVELYWISILDLHMSCCNTCIWRLYFIICRFVNFGCANLHEKQFLTFDVLVIHAFDLLNWRLNSSCEDSSGLVGRSVLLLCLRLIDSVRLPSCTSLLIPHVLCTLLMFLFLSTHSLSMTHIQRGSAR